MSEDGSQGGEPIPEKAAARRYNDPLYIAPEVKKPEFDYQWFDRREHGPWRCGTYFKDEGWKLVECAAMPDEPSDDSGYIRRKELFLFYRPVEISEQEAEALRDEAFRSVGALDSFFSREGPQPAFTGIGLAFVPQGTRPFELRPARNGFVKSRRIFVIHESRTRWQLRPLLAWIAPLLLKLRIVYFKRDAAEMACRCGISYAEWAWHTLCLTREGLLGKRG